MSRSLTDTQQHPDRHPAAHLTDTPANARRRYRATAPSRPANTAGGGSTRVAAAPAIPTPAPTSRPTSKPGVSVAGELLVKLDPSPLSDPDLFSAEERRALINEVLDGMLPCRGKIVEHVSTGDLPAARQAAHWARNNALIIGARDLADSLAVLEAACRAGSLPSTRAAAAAAEELWDPTCEAIEALLHAA